MECFLLRPAGAVASIKRLPMYLQAESVVHQYHGHDQQMLVAQDHGNKVTNEEFPSLLELAHSLPTNGDDELDAVSQLPGHTVSHARVDASVFFQQTTVLSPAQSAEDREICRCAMSGCMAPVASQELDAPPSSPASSPFTFSGVFGDIQNSSGMITPLSSTPTATQSARPETAAFGSPFKPSTALRPLSRSDTGSRSVRMHAHDASANQPSAVRALTASLQLLSTTANGYEEDYSDDGGVDDFASRSPRSPPFRVAHRRQGLANVERLRAVVGTRQKDERDRFDAGGCDGEFSDDESQWCRPRQHALRHDRSRPGMV